MRYSERRLGQTVSKYIVRCAKCLCRFTPSFSFLGDKAMPSVAKIKFDMIDLIIGDYFGP